MYAGRYGFAQLMDHLPGSYTAPRGATVTSLAVNFGPGIGRQTAPGIAHKGWCPAP
jgi:hypothetical protein